MGCSNSQSSINTSFESVDTSPSGTSSRSFHDTYDLGVKLGRGAYAQVYVCTEVGQREGEEDPKENPTEAAVKVLDLNYKDRRSAALGEQARIEALFWQSIGNHPNCVSLHDVFYDDRSCFMVMEKCSSGFLQALKSMPEHTERNLGNVCVQILSGISHCHSVGIVHRDIKAENILAGGANGQDMKLADFGLAVRLPESGTLSRSSIVGTAPYVCPEMLTKWWYNEKVDVWSFGVVVYTLLFGVFPYMPKDMSSKSMKEAISKDIEPPSFKPVQVGLGPAALERSENAVSMVRALLNRDPRNRPSAKTALDMAWMRSALQGTHMMDKDLPSLRPMLQSAEKIGAFGRDADRTERCKSQHSMRISELTQ